LDKYNIVYSKEARQDLLDLKRYIKYNLQEPNIAKKLTDKIKMEINKLVNNSKIYSIIDDELIKKFEIRRIIVDNYIVFYRINNDKIQIVRIIYSRRNWINLL
jgi:addiction module RelE/StbE family toxin